MRHWLPATAMPGGPGTGDQVAREHRLIADQRLHRRQPVEGQRRGRGPANTQSPLAAKARMPKSRQLVAPGVYSPKGNKVELVIDRADARAENSVRLLK